MRFYYLVIPTCWDMPQLSLMNDAERMFKRQELSLLLAMRVPTTVT